jgi:hypothetical protein
MRRSSTSLSMDCSRPRLAARAMRTVSTVRNTSAGLLAPSACIRAISSSALPSIRLIVMPVASVKSE